MHWLQQIIFIFESLTTALRVKVNISQVIIVVSHFEKDINKTLFYFIIS